MTCFELFSLTAKFRISIFLTQLKSSIEVPRFATTCSQQRCLLTTDVCVRVCIMFFLCLFCCCCFGGFKIRTRAHTYTHAQPKHDYLLKENVFGSDFLLRRILFWFLHPTPAPLSERASLLDLKKGPDGLRLKSTKVQYTVLFVFPAHCH